MSVQVIDILGLVGLKPLRVIDAGDHYRVEAEGRVLPTACPACFQGLYRHGSQPQTYLDTPMHGKRVLIELDRKRYRCKACGKTLFEPLPDMDSKRLATTRLVQYVERHCLRKTFAELSREVGVDEKTVRHIFDDYVAGLKDSVVFEPPELLGIDELKIIGQYRCMLTNVERLALFDMLPTRAKVDLLTYFKAMPGKEKVKVLTMDLWSVYRQVAQDQFPGRMIVADRFHVVRMANDSVERVRKAIRKDLSTKDRIKLKDDRFVLLSRKHNLGEAGLAKLEAWELQYPALVAAYEAKEAFHDIYSQPTKDDAIRAALEWEASLPPIVADAFRETRGALRSWWNEIFNYYDCPISNAYTESINNLAKGMNRMGRGYSFDVIRARLLYDDDARKDTRTTIRKKPRKAAPTFSGMGRMVPSMVAGLGAVEETVIEYGPYIPTLIRKLNAGEFE